MSNDTVRRLNAIDQRYRDLIKSGDLPRSPEVIVEVDEEAAEVARQLMNECDRDTDMWEWLNDVMQPQFVYKLPSGAEVRPGK